MSPDRSQRHERDPKPVWLEWGEEASAAARAGRRPVLVLLFARWCRFSRELEQRVLTDERVAACLAERFVCVRVDKDRRPDLDARLSIGGWPTLAYLDEAGHVLSRDGFLEAGPLVARLELIADHHAEHRGALRRRLLESDPRPLDATARARFPAEAIAWVAKTLLETADPIHGGWGGPHKFPHPEAVDFALIRWSETGDEAMRKLVLRTLRNMQGAEIHDTVEGGFYRFATARDWSGPHHEKTLASNAARAFAYLEAHQALGEESFARTARGVLEWMNEALRDPATGAYRGSQDADAAYAHLTTRESRRQRGAPSKDPTIFADANALAARALFKAGVVLRDARWTARGVEVLEFLLEELYDERMGVHHYHDGCARLPGLLGDQAAVIAALLDAAQYTGESRWLEPARAIRRRAVETLRAESGAFLDRRPQAGQRGEAGIVDNSAMAEALLRLALFTHEPADRELAVDALCAFATDYKRHGHFIAGFARALALIEHPPVHVTIVAEPGATLAGELRRAALEPYVSSRVVQTLYVGDDDPWIARLGLADGWRGALQSARAFVQRGRESYAETSDPARLPALMARIERPE